MDSPILHSRRKAEKYYDVDEILELSGGFGKFQIMIEIMFCIAILPESFQLFLMYFTANNPGWRCVSTSKDCNITSDVTPGSDNYEIRCQLQRNEWEYTRPKEYSIVTEFDLYCENEHIPYVISTCFFMSWASGAVVLGWNADRYGRKNVLFLSLMLMMIIGFTGTFAQSVTMYGITQSFVGFFIPGVGIQMFVMASELVGPKFRPMTGILIWVSLTVGYMILGIKAYFIRQWRYLITACTLPYIFTIVFYKFVPESVRWLRMQGRMNEAKEILGRIAQSNNAHFTNEIFLKPASQADLQHKPSLLHLFDTLKMAKISCILGLSWFVDAAVYFGISLAADDLGGSMYRDFILSSLIELPGASLAIVACMYCGRKFSTIISMIIAGISCIIVSFIPDKETDPSYLPYRLAVGLIGKFFISLSFDAIYTWGAELYPTLIRSEALGFLLVASRAGAASAIWISKWLKLINRALPFAVMGTLALIFSVPLLLLRETIHLKTLESMKDEGIKNNIDNDADDDDEESEENKAHDLLVG